MTRYDTHGYLDIVVLYYYKKINKKKSKRNDNFSSLKNPIRSRDDLECFHHFNFRVSRPTGLFFFSNRYGYGYRYRYGYG